MAVRVIRKFRLLLDVIWGTPADGDVVTYDSGQDKLVLAPPTGGGAPNTADYLVGTAQAGLSGEIVVGASPGGELGGTWASPTVDTVHSGSSHAAVQAAAEATAAAGLAAHTGDATDAHDASAISVSPAGGIAADDVQEALQELDSEKAAAVHAHAGEDITSGTVADARIAATIARDSEVTAAIAASEAGQVRDGDAAGGVLSGTYPNPGFAADMATQAELDAHVNDGTDAHDASAISFVPNGSIAATDVQAAIQEVRDEAAGGGVLDNAVILAPATDARNVIVPTLATVIALTLRGAVAQSEKLLVVQNSDLDELFSIAPDGKVVMGRYVAGQNALVVDPVGASFKHFFNVTDSRYQLVSNGTLDFGLPANHDAGALMFGTGGSKTILSGGGSSLAKFRLFTHDILTSPVMEITDSTTTFRQLYGTVPVLVVKGHATQSGAMFVVEESDGDDLFVVGPTGEVTITPTGTATADSLVSPALKIIGKERSFYSGKQYLALASYSPDSDPAWSNDGAYLASGVYETPGGTIQRGWLELHQRDPSDGRSTGYGYLGPNVFTFDDYDSALGAGGEYATGYAEFAPAYFTLGAPPSGTTVIRLDSTGFGEFTEVTAPAAAAANKLRFFARDSGGKTQFCVRFATGAIHVIAEQDAGDLAAHLADTTDAHDASAISIADAANDFTATDVEGALAELQAADELDEAALAAHLSDATDAHDASAISSVAAGNLVATDVQAALNELDAEKQPLDADLTTIAGLADPNADRILFWDDSAGAYTYLTPGTNLSITGTTLDATGGGGGEAMSRSITQTAHGLVVGNVVRHNGTNFVKAQADSVANAEVAGIVSAVADANTFTLHYGGRITGLSGLTAGTVYFLDDDTAGLLTSTEPSDAGDVSKPVLISDSTTSGLFFNMRGQVVTASDPDRVLLYDSTLGADAATFDTGAILAGYTHLEVVCMLRVTDGANTVTLRFNNDSGANYAYQLSYAAGTQTLSSVSGQTSIAAFLCAASTSPADLFTAGKIEIPFYGSGKLKTCMTRMPSVVPGFGSNNQYQVGAHGIWNSTAAITRLALIASANFVAGSRVQVYGTR